jgi:Chaperone of endosialidase
MKNRLLYTVVLLALGCLAYSPEAWAVSPAPDGGYLGGNTAEGQNALFSLTTGGFNTAVGFLSLRTSTTAMFNTAIGAGALLTNTANQNTATGAGALLSNTTGDANTAIGAFALLNNTTGLVNTANGLNALFSNTTGSNNTANGEEALESNIAGNHNTAVGSSALRSLTAGDENIAVGSFAGVNLTTGDRNIHIGNVGVAGEDHTMRIGSDGSQTRTFIAGIRGVLTANSVPVVIDPSGQLGTIGGSSRRFKKEIQPMGEASESILALKPVTFHYKTDTTNTAQFGLIAEDVAQVNPDLVVRDDKSEIYAVRYEAVNAMLLNEFLKEHKKVEQQAREIRAQKAAINRLSTTLETAIAHIEEHDLKIRRVNEQIEINQFATRQIRGGETKPQIVSND